MSKKFHSKNILKALPPSEIDVAYEQAQQLLKARNQGYVAYNRIFTSVEQVQASFPDMIIGDILIFFGNQFYWKRSAKEPLVLFAESEETQELKSRGLIEIARVNVPEGWIGVGYFRISWPKRKPNQADALFLISLYLYSTNIGDFEHLIAERKTEGAFMAALFLDQENSDLFNRQAEERFDALR